jgi:transposase-like protein
MVINNLASGFMHNMDEAHKFLEAIRWPNGPVCPHCHNPGGYRLKETKTGRRPLKCKKCRKLFSLTVGTIFEDSHIPLTKWAGAIHLMCASKKGMSAHQLHRMLGVTYKTAWFMAHRIRHTMKQFPALEQLKGIVEADETYIGGKSHRGGGQTGFENKTMVFSLVERQGSVRSFTPGRVTGGNLGGIIKEHTSPDARIMTDQASHYRSLKWTAIKHESVDHSRKEWVRGDVHTNTVEGYFGLLKRGIIGTYHHVSKQHLHRYLAEFDFRYNARKTTDFVRMELAMKAIEGKRLQYKATIKRVVMPPT